MNANFRDGTIVIKDGTSGTPLEVTVLAALGDFSASGFKAGGNYETAVTQVRGEVHSIRRTNRIFPTISFSLLISEFSIDTGENVIDLLEGTEDYAARVSTNSLGDVITFDIEFTMDVPGGTETTWTFEDVEITYDFAESEASSLTLNGTVYGAYPRSIAA